MFPIKQNSNSPSLRVRLEPAPINLTGAQSVKFSMKLRDATTLTIDEADMVIEDAPTGVIRYDWQLSDTVAPGIYDSEIKVVYADGSIERFPNLDYTVIRIDPEI